MITPEGRPWRPLLWFVCSTLLAVPALCQSHSKAPDQKPYALIFGTVYAPDKRPVYGVKVKIRREDHKRAQWEHISDHQGEFAQRVPAGPAKYFIWAETKGKAPRTEVTVQVHNDERVDVGLHLTE